MSDINTIENVDELISIGEAAAQRGDKNNARTALRKAVKLEPTNTQALLALATVVGTFTERRQLYEQVLTLDPSNISAKGGLEALQSGAANPHPVQPAKIELPIDPRPLTPPLTEPLFCYRHPTVETGLRCIQCSNPICANCAKATPVGFLCPDCRKARRSPLYNVTPVDAAKAGAVSVVAGAIGTFLASLAGIFILIFFGAAMGEAVIRVITWATNKRGIIIQLVAGAGLVAGALIALIFFRVASIIGLVVFLLISIGMVVSRLR